MTPVYCECCERPAERRDLGVIRDSGEMGHVAGIACAACGHIAPLEGAPFIPNGKRIEIPPGMTAFEYFAEAVRAAGGAPRRRA